MSNVLAMVTPKQNMVSGFWLYGIFGIFENVAAIMLNSHGINAITEPKVLGLAIDGLIASRSLKMESPRIGNSVICG